MHRLAHDADSQASIEHRGGCAYLSLGDRAMPSRSDRPKYA
jgi:hypothetical protein